MKFTHEIPSLRVEASKSFCLYTHSAERKQAAHIKWNGKAKLHRRQQLSRNLMFKWKLRVGNFHLENRLLSTFTSIAPKKIKLQSRREFKGHRKMLYSKPLYCVWMRMDEGWWRPDPSTIHILTRGHNRVGKGANREKIKTINSHRNREKPNWNWMQKKKETRERTIWRTLGLSIMLVCFWEYVMFCHHRSSVDSRLLAGGKLSSSMKERNFIAEGKRRKKRQRGKNI